MKVTLISTTPNAADLLIFTKNTRLKMSPSLLEEISGWSEDRKTEELSYISRTVPSSHEFVEYVFVIEDVTRAFTHQLVRTRQASYAQQAMRIVRVSQADKPFGYLTGPTIANNPEAAAVYHSVMRTVDQGYNKLIDLGASSEDARGVLPTNIYTNIVAKFNLRAFAELARKRGTARTQSEYRDVLVAMKAAIYAKHAWASVFIEPKKHTVAKKLEALAEKVRPTNELAANDIIKEAEILSMEMA